MNTPVSLGVSTLFRGDLGESMATLWSLLGKCSFSNRSIVWTMVDRTRRTVLATVGGTVAFGLAGCSETQENGTDDTSGTSTDGDGTDGTSDDETTVDETTETMADGMANVRVAHMSPDAPNVDVYVDGDPVLTDVP